MRNYIIADRKRQSASFLSSYIRKVDERVAGRVIFCYEDFSKSY